MATLVGLLDSCEPGPPHVSALQRFMLVAPHL